MPPWGAQCRAHTRHSMRWALLAETTCPAFWQERGQKWNGLGASEGLQLARHLLSPEPQLLAEIPHSGRKRPCPAPPILDQPPGVPQTTQLRAHPVLPARDVEVAGRRVNSSSRCTGPNHQSCVVGESGKPSEERMRGEGTAGRGSCLCRRMTPGGGFGKLPAVVPGCC